MGDTLFSGTVMLVLFLGLLLVAILFLVMISKSTGDASSVLGATIART